MGVVGLDSCQVTCYSSDIENNKEDMMIELIHQEIKKLEEAIHGHERVLGVLGQKGGMKPRWKEEEDIYVEAFREIVRARRKIVRAKVLLVLEECLPKETRS